MFVWSSELHEGYDKMLDGQEVLGGRVGVKIVNKLAYDRR